MLRDIALNTLVRIKHALSADTDSKEQVRWATTAAAVTFLSDTPRCLGRAKRQFTLTQRNWQNNV